MVPAAASLRLANTQWPAVILIEIKFVRFFPPNCICVLYCCFVAAYSRIHGMVERLCSAYGSELLPSSSTASSSGSSNCTSWQPQQQPGASAPSTPQKQQQQQQLIDSQPPDVGSAAGKPTSMDAFAAASPPVSLPFGAATVAAEAAEQQAPGHQTSVAVQQQADKVQQQQQQQQQQLAFYAFPTLQQLSAATEEALRADGFGYRCAWLATTAAAAGAAAAAAAVRMHPLHTCGSCLLDGFCPAAFEKFMQISVVVKIL
jgi:hypothetical protein